MELCSVKEFMEFTGLGKTLVYQYTRARGFPKIQTVKKGRIMIPRDEAIAWLKAQTAARGA